MVMVRKATDSMNPYVPSLIGESWESPLDLRIFPFTLASGKRLHSNGKIHHAKKMGKLTISTGPFSSSRTVSHSQAG